MHHKQTNNHTNDCAPAERLIKSGELRKRLGVEKKKLLRWISDGIVPAIRPPGSRIYYFDWPTIRNALLRFQTVAKAK